MKSEATNPSGAAQLLAWLLDDNLMSVLRLEPQLRQMNYRVQTLHALPEVTPSEAAPELIVINLGSRGLNGAALVGSCRERFPAARVVGFCGHLETEIHRAAKAAGISKILTNDQALSNLQQCL